MIFSHGLQDFEITVVNIGLGEVKREDFPFIVDYQMQFEAEEPAYRTLASLSDTSEGFVLVYPAVMANPQRCRIHKTYPGEAAESFIFEKQHERNGHPFLQFYKPIVRDQPWKKVFHMSTCVVVIEALKVTELTIVKKYKDTHDL